MLTNVIKYTIKCHVNVKAIPLIFGKFQRHAHHLSIDFP